MALAAYVDHFAVDTSAAGTPRVLSGFGHTPKLWLPWLALHTTLAGWSAADFQVGMGVSAGVAAEMAHCLRLNDAATGGLTRRGSQADSCLISVLRNTNTEDGAYDTASLDAGGGGGVSLNISNAFGAAQIAPYLSLGGDELVEADVLEIATPTDAGLPYDRTYTFTGLTGEPTLLFLEGVGRTSLGFGTTGAVFLGAADADGQWAMMTKASETNPTESWRIFRSDRCYAAHVGGASSIRLRAALQSFGFNGTNGTVTLTWDAVPTTESQIITLTALRGTFSHKVGVFTKAVSAPWTNTISLGATPRALFVATAAMTAMGTPNDAATHCRGGIGLYDGTRARAIAWQDEHGVATSNIAGYLEDSGAILAISDNATASSNDVLTPAFSGTDAVLTSTLEEAVAYEVGYVLLGDSATTDATVPATTITIPASLPAPTPSAGATIAGTLLAVSGSIPSPTISAGAGVAAATVAAGAIIGAADLSLGTSATPSTIAATASAPSPSVTTDAATNVGVATVAVIAAIPAATLSTGISLNAATIMVAASVPPALVLTLTLVDADTLEGTVTIPPPTVAASSSIAAAVVLARALIPAPAVSAGNVIVASLRRGCTPPQATNRRVCATTDATVNLATVGVGVGV